MRFPNPLATRRGRLATFFALYLTEGIPLGFTATAIATQMRRQGIGPAEIGAFVGSLYLPWAWKWAVGPFVDVFSSDRFGRRRLWILLAQVMMVVTLMVAWPVNFGSQLKFFTILILIHNAFAATQDVAIDALAVDVLSEKERGTANGLMFGGAYIGQAVGGSGALLLAPHIGFSNTYFFIAACILAVTLFIVVPMREPSMPRMAPVGSALAHAGREVWRFVTDAFRAFTGSRAAWVGVVNALLPAGAFALGLALQSNLAVELGLDDTQVGMLNLWALVLSGICCVAGGWISDRYGRRRSLALFIFCTTLPTAYLGWEMLRAGWIMPVSPTLPNRPVASPELVAVFWATVMVYNVFQGLYYGIRSALFMDITTPRVAATQFTAYMALSNYAIAFAAQWQGWAVERWGYPKTLAVDCLFGLVGLLLLPLMTPRPHVEPPPGAAVPEAIAP